MLWWGIKCNNTESIISIISIILLHTHPSGSPNLILVKSASYLNLGKTQLKPTKRRKLFSKILGLMPLSKVIDRILTLIHVHIILSIFLLFIAKT